jgi:hypothetical protein
LETTFAEVIYVNIEAELNTQCFNEGLRSYFPCYSNKFEVYAYHGKDHISGGNLLDIFSQSFYNITNNTNLAKANLTRSTQTTFFIPQTNSEGVTFAVRSRGACGKIFRIKMYYHVCKEKIIKTIKFERTSSPAKGFKNVTANCSENSIPSQNAARFKGYCYPNGSWRIPLDDNMECLCVEGYTLNKRDRSCSSKLHVNCIVRSILRYLFLQLQVFVSYNIVCRFLSPGLKISNLHRIHAELVFALTKKN